MIMYGPKLTNPQTYLYQAQFQTPDPFLKPKIKNRKPGKLRYHSLRQCWTPLGPHPPDFHPGSGLGRWGSSYAASRSPRTYPYIGRVSPHFKF